MSSNSNRGSRFFLIALFLFSSLGALSAQSYVVENQWGGQSAPWRAGGIWIIGGRSNQAVSSLAIESKDKGASFSGKMSYEGEGPIGFRAKLLSNNVYAVENFWGGNNGKWHKGGTWILGGRDNQALVGVEIVSKDKGKSYSGTITYAGEGPIGFRAVPGAPKAQMKSVVPFSGYVYATQNRWGGESGSWNAGGEFILGSREGQLLTAMDLKSADSGKTLTGTMTYAGEGPISVKATALGTNLYRVESQWGGEGAKWNAEGTWKIGSRDKQSVVAIAFASKTKGSDWEGSLTYSGEGPIDLKGALSKK